MELTFTLLAFTICFGGSVLLPCHVLSLSVYGNFSLYAFPIYCHVSVISNSMHLVKAKQPSLRYVPLHVFYCSNVWSFIACLELELFFFVLPYLDFCRFLFLPSVGKSKRKYTTSIIFIIIFEIVMLVLYPFLSTIAFSYCLYFMNSRQFDYGILLTVHIHMVI